MYIINCFYWAYEMKDGKEVKVQKSFEHKAYCCPHCESDVEYIEADVDRAHVGCSMCDYTYWVTPDGKEEEIE